MRSAALLFCAALLFSCQIVSRAETDEDGDDTADVDTETTADRDEAVRGLLIRGDFRPILDTFHVDERDGSEDSETILGARLRVGGDFGLTEKLRVGARVAGVGLTGPDDFDPEFVFQVASPAPNGLENGQFTFDELYVHAYRTDQFSLVAGRMQTRFVLRSGVWARSLDRVDSNNVNVTWTDGIQATYRATNGWNTSFILQRNASDGSGGIRYEPLDFDDSAARNTYFVGAENIESWGLVVQRAFDVSYLPSSLLEDGDPDGRRADYWAVVGRLALRWPQRPTGTRLRGGAEIGYAPNTQTAEGANLERDADGLAWNVVVSLMDFIPTHNIGVNYGRVGAGWLLSPQFRPNEEQLEFRYQWRNPRWPLVEARIRWREDLEQPVETQRKRDTLDAFLRLTWEFGKSDR
ncbi:MAG: hypothetical protein JSU95_00180 [Betaproteobacteria bacterium]|nr:MAG: hypothetical protein JSU95_00180 [Betaproteobacteria bacterium]